jgi:hypothetical protein
MNKTLRDYVQDAHLNFLVGSGLSVPYFPTLGPVEQLLTELDARDCNPNERALVSCALYKHYFDGVMNGNLALLNGDSRADLVRSRYLKFVRLLEKVLMARKSPILGKEANIFTTNIDIFLDLAIEQAAVECNDGFSGRFNPVFSHSNFRKTHSKRSLQYDVRSEIPTINLVKIHGSLNWHADAANKILFTHDLKCVSVVAACKISAGLLPPVSANCTLDELLAGCAGKMPDASVTDFMNAYDKLAVVNPTKAKFKLTLMNETHYELLRLFSNELEKENALLLVMGFSFADEHIRQLAIRTANANPTLSIRVFAYNGSAADSLEKLFPEDKIRNGNIEIVRPPTPTAADPSPTLDFQTLNDKIFRGVLDIRA